MATMALPQTQFATLAIGATAQRMGITATELHNRLKRHGLVRRLLLDCYDTLHAESIDGVVWNVQEALKNWDAKEGGHRRPLSALHRHRVRSRERRRAMRDQVLWRKEGRIVALLAECLDIDAERALDILYNSRTFVLLTNPDSGLCLQSDEYILNDLLKELEV